MSQRLPPHHGLHQREFLHCIAAAGFCWACRSEHKLPPKASTCRHAICICSHGTASDPVLLYISSYLASHPPSRPVPLATDPHLGSSSGSSIGNSSGRANSSGSGSALPLSPEMHMWQLQWEELEIERPIGHRSFGAVYRARWQETTVAVKVLIDKGAHLLACLLLAVVRMAAADGLVAWRTCRKQHSALGRALLKRDASSRFPLLQIGCHTAAAWSCQPS